MLNKSTHYGGGGNVYNNINDNEGDKFGASNKTTFMLVLIRVVQIQPS